MPSLQAFIDGSLPPAQSPRRVPKKLAADEEAYRGLRYTSIEPTDRGSHHGAFSTDLGSYPDTSTNDTQNQFLLYPNKVVTQNYTISHSRSSNSPDLVDQATASIQYGLSQQHLSQPNQSNGTPPGGGETQAFEEFSRKFDQDANNLMDLLEESNDSPLASQELPGRASFRLPESSQKILPFKSSPSSQPILADKGGHLGTITHVQQQSNKPMARPNTSRFVRPAVPQKAVTFEFGANRVPARSRHMKVIPDSQEENIMSDEAVQPEVTSVSQATAQSILTPAPAKATSIQDRWPLKRRPSLSTVELELTDKELLAKPFTALDEDARPVKDEARLPDLDKLITSIINEKQNEDQLLLQIAKLSKDKWVEFGDSLNAESTKIITELKNLRDQKRYVATKFENEAAKMMDQVQNNDSSVEGRLQHLRQFGVKMLGGAAT